MSRYLLDTNHMGVLLDGRSGLRERLRDSLKLGHRFGTCLPVLCELETGIHQTSRREHNRRILAQLLVQIRIWPLTLRVAPIYAEIYHNLRASGRVLSQVDMLVAALACSMDATVLSSDRDFTPLPGVRVDNWLA